MVKLKGCHFIHESMLYFALRCSRLLSSLLNHLKLQQQPIFRTINRSSYDVRTHISKVSHLVKREMRSQVWIYQSLCAARSSSASENAQNGTKAIRLCRINGYLLGKRRTAVTH